MRVRPPGGPNAIAAAAVLLAAMALPAMAQESGAAAGRGLRVSSGLTAAVSYFDGGSGGTGGDFVTELRPSVQIVSRGGRVRGSLSYSLSAISHSRNSGDNDVQNALNAAFTAELLDNRFYVDAAANISQAVVSAYGQQTYSNLQANPNRVEVADVSVSPYVRGVLGGVATYDVRLTAAATNARDSILADRSSTGAVVTLGSPRGGTVFGWGAQALTQTVDYRAGRRTRSDRVILSLIATPDPDLVLTVRGGQESTDVIGFQRQSYDNWGFEMRWTPSPRTVASLSTDHRYFGQSREVLLEHRFQRSSIRFTSTRGANDGGQGLGNINGNGVGQSISLFTLFYNQFASIQPDPILRQQFVLDYLRTLGLDPAAVVGGGFLNPAVSLNRREDLTYSLVGIRATITLQAFVTRSTVLDTLTQTSGDGDVRQQGFTATVAYRMTPTMSANLTGAQLRSLSNGTREGNQLRTASLSVSEQVGRRSSVSFGARHSRFTGATQPYSDSSVTASYTTSF